MEVLAGRIELEATGSDISKDCFSKDALFGPNRLAEDYWVAAERAKTFSLLFPGATFDRAAVEMDSTLPSADDALLTLVTGWMSHWGPATSSYLGQLLGLPAPEIEKAMLRMEASGAVLRGQFTGKGLAGGARPRQQ